MNFDSLSVLYIFIFQGLFAWGAFWYVSLCNTTVLCMCEQYLSHLCVYSSVCPSVITPTCIGMQVSRLSGSCLAGSEISNIYSSTIDWGW